MNILVTGANGFVGRAAVAALRRKGHAVTALDLKEEGRFMDDDGVVFLKQDITLPFALRDRFDAVLHLAARNVTHVGTADAADFHRVNVEGTRHLLGAAADARWVFLSTVKVYAPAEGLLDEGAPLAPAGAYERSKLQAEELCRQRIPADRLVILRSVNIIGPGQAEKAVVPVFFRCAVRGEPLRVFGPRRQLLQLLDVEDAAFALCAALEGKVSGVLNLATDETVRLDELARRIVALAASTSAIIADNDAPCPEVRYNSRRITEALGWRPRLGLEESLQRCLRSYAG